VTGKVPSDSSRKPVPPRQPPKRSRRLFSRRQVGLMLAAVLIGAFAVW